MGRTFLRQSVQIRQSVTYDDTLAAGSTMETAPTELERDLNSLRSQVKRLFLADVAGDWFQDVDTIGGVKRGIKALATDLYDIETHKILCRVQVLTDITVTAAQNWEILSFAGAETPTEAIAIAATALGAVVAVSAFSGAGFNVHELVEAAGPNAISPKNLLVVRDSTTGQKIQSSGRDVFGLLQAESTAVDGGAFNDTSAGNRGKISFVRLTTGLDDLEACAVADIAGTTINYSYIDRHNLDTLPEHCFLGDGSFVDQTATTDVTLNNAIDNQGGPATQTDRNIDWRITDTFTLKFQDSTGGTSMLAIMPNAAGDEIEVNVDILDINNAQDADFLNGAKFDTGGTEIDIGVTAGYVSTTGAADLGIRGAGELYLDDGNQTGSTWAQTAGIKLSDTTTEWDDFETAFGEVSLLKAIYMANSAAARSKTTAAVTANTAADTDVGGAGGGTNLDAQLGDYSLVNFVTDVDVYLNGQLLRNGANAAANHDVYPGTSAATGQVKFEFGVLASPGNPDTITMIVW